MDCGATGHTEVLAIRRNGKEARRVEHLFRGLPELSERFPGLAFPQPSCVARAEGDRLAVGRPADRVESGSRLAWRPGFFSGGSVEKANGVVVCHEQGLAVRRKGERLHSQKCRSKRRYLLAGGDVPE